jgi:hypothetical protein
MKNESKGASLAMLSWADDLGECGTMKLGVDLKVLGKFSAPEI